MRDPKELARLLKVLSVETRVRIVQLLKDRALCVNALAARLDVTQGAVSQHLRVMRDAGLVMKPSPRGERISIGCWTPSMGPAQTRKERRNALLQ